MAVSPERFHVRSMLDELIDTIKPMAEKNSNAITVTCADGLETMYADLTKTRQILLNLLSNAAKFTNHGSIMVDVKHRTVDGVPCVEFSVTDTGCGMTREQSGKVFDAFTQADVTTTRKYGGTGLGLAIVSKFCELMRGSVSVESQIGKGSRFAVLLPLEMVDTAVDSAMPVGAV
jgi:signal transduction histidine kinase